MTQEKFPTLSNLQSQPMPETQEMSRFVPAPQTLLVAQELSKSYGPRQAVKGLSFTLQAGRVLGFLGPNGAGKTTAIRMLTTILEPDSGSFFVDGIGSEYPDQIRRKIGVLPESLGFPKQMTGIEYLTFFGQLYGQSATDARANGMRLLEGVGLKHRAKSLIGTYSHGMRQRIGIARALVNDPVVIFLDEPTLGLDPRGQQELLAMIRQIARERNAGIILCSHMLSEIESICDDVIILNMGQVVTSGPVEKIIGQTRQNAIRIHVAPALIARAQQVLQTIPNLTKVTVVGETADWLRVELGDMTDDTTDQQVKTKILDALVRAEIPISSFEAEGGRLQDVFLQLTKE